MPVAWPATPNALNLVDFNINPHYSDWKPPNYQGETRNDRLDEWIIRNKKPIVAVSEGVGILVERGKHTLIAPKLATDNGDVVRCAKLWQPDESAEKGFKVVDLPLGSDITSYIS